MTFVSAVSNDDNESVLTAVQLLWVNLIMDTFAALALATDPPTDKILDRKPSPKSAPLFTTTMWKMIVGQSIYQLAVTFTLYFAGARILGYDLTNDPDGTLKKQLHTIVFNTFVWMQIFNEFNNRRLDNNFNIFEGIHKNYWFIGINCVMIGGQIMIIFVGGAALSVTRIDGVQWAICILCAIFCMPFAVLLRCIPDRYAAVIIDIVKVVFKFVWIPISKGLSFVFLPIGKCFKAIWTPFGRLFSRFFKKKEENDDKVAIEKGRSDEEAPAELNGKATDNGVSSPVAPPPITLTGPA